MIMPYLFRLNITRISYQHYKIKYVVHNFTELKSLSFFENVGDANKIRYITNE